MTSEAERLARHEEYLERLARHEKFTRTIRTATTYLRKAQGWLYNDPPSMVEFSDLLDVSIETSTEIIERLPDSFFESEELTDYFGLLSSLREFGEPIPSTYNSSDEALEAAEKLVAAIKARRERGQLLSRIKRLEAVEGRTPEEAEAYLSKARELREAL